MKKYQIKLNNENETKEYAKKIAAELKIGDVIVLTGELGSGKTKFTEGILEYFNLQDEISSPTFTIVNEYHTPSFPLYHFDVYRLEEEEEFLAIGGDEYFEKGVCIIEWGEMIEDLLPNKYIKICFSKDENDINVRFLDITEL